MQQVRRVPTQISLAVRLPALLLPLPSPSPRLRSDCRPLLHCIPLHKVKPANARTNVAGQSVAEQKVMGLAARLGCRQELQYGQHCRRVLLVCGTGVQDGCAITLPNSLWPIFPSLFVFSCYHGRSSGQIRCSSYSPLWKISTPSANTSVNSVDTQTIEQLWELYFADASQWWDNRVEKKNPKSSDFKHKVTRRALWIHGSSTPAWVKARLRSMTDGRLQRHAGYGTQDTGQGERLPNGNNGAQNIVSTSTKELRQSVQGRGGSMHLQSASTTSEAISILQNRLKQGISIDSYMYVEVLKQCLKQKDFKLAKQVHECIIKSGMDQNTYVGNFLVSVYISCGRLQEARQVFDGLVEKNVYTWTIMIGGYAESDNAKDAMEIYNQSREESVQANAITYLSILKACGSALALKWGKEVHAHIEHDGFESDVRVGTALINMYAKCGCMKEARQTFEKLSSRNVITWTVMIAAYAQNGCVEEAYGLLLEMRREGFTPNEVTYLSILNVCASAGALEWVKEVHRHVLEAGHESDLRLGSALVHIYAKSGSIDDARLVFDRMDDRDVVTWNIMIGGLAQHGCAQEALEVFRKMNAEGVKPDGLSFVAVLSACSHAGLVDEGRRLFLAMSQEYGIEPTLVHHTCMVDLLGRAGHLEEAKLIIDSMPVAPNGATWRALLGACRTHGNVELGELTSKEILKLEPEDSSTYVVLSNIYAAAGMWDEVSSVRNMMQERGIRKEPGRSWIEVDNKIHRFIVGDTSHPEAKEIYAELNRLTERIKAEGYFPDTRLVLENIDEEDKEVSLCSHSEKLAITYGLMRTPHGKPIRVYKNLRVCSDCHTATKFISKVTGREIVARDANRFHHFIDGVCSCGDYW